VSVSCVATILCEAEKAHLQIVYSQQQQQHLESLGGHTCPHLAFFRDLSTTLFPLQLVKDSIVFMADVNGDIHGPDLTAFCTMHALLEAILSAHPHLPTLATFKWGSCHGNPRQWYLGLLRNACCILLLVCFPLEPRGPPLASLTWTYLLSLVNHSKRLSRQLTCSIPFSQDSYNLHILEAAQQHSLLQMACPLCGVDSTNF